LIHGEFYVSNVLVHETDTGTRICPVDWEMAAIGPGLIDLAALTAGSWSEDERRGFARIYHDALTPAAGGWQPFDEMVTDLTYCRLHLAVQWLGWSADWMPPREHAQDWLAEATRLAEELRL
jgi:aminoglycoside phosphotransferase (APT) family kinase protein